MLSFRARGAHEWESMVAAARPSFTAEFFAHAENLVRAAAADGAEQEGAHCILFHRFSMIMGHSCVACLSALRKPQRRLVMWEPMAWACVSMPLCFG